MSDIMDTVMRNPWIVILVGFMIFCFVKGGNSKDKDGKGGGGSSTSSTPPTAG